MVFETDKGKKMIKVHEYVLRVISFRYFLMFDQFKKSLI